MCDSLAVREWEEAEDEEEVEEEAYRDEDAVCVFGLAALVCAHEVGEARDVADAHHVDVVVEAERLDEREVDL